MKWNFSSIYEYVCVYIVHIYVNIYTYLLLFLATSERRSDAVSVAWWQSVWIRPCLYECYTI